HAATPTHAAALAHAIAAATAPALHFGQDLLLVIGDLGRADLAVMIGVQHHEIADEIRLELWPGEGAVMIGIGLVEPCAHRLRPAFRAAERLAGRADEQTAPHAHPAGAAGPARTHAHAGPEMPAVGLGGAGGERGRAREDEDQGKGPAHRAYSSTGGNGAWRWRGNCGRGKRKAVSICRDPQAPAAVNLSTCSPVSSSVSTPSSSSSWARLVALAIGAVTPGWAASQARATWAGVAPASDATSSSAASTRKPRSLR